MAGMINTKMAQAQGLPQDDPNAPGGPLDETDTPGVPEDEQDAPGAGSNPEQNPAYAAGIKMAMEALYRKGAAQEIAQGLKTADDPVAALADAAYEIVSLIDERTDGQVPDELIVSLATQILGEVAEIGQAAGLKIDGQAIAGAMQKMLLRYLTENHIDSGQLQSQLAQIDPAVLGRELDQTTGD